VDHNIWLSLVLLLVDGETSSSHHHGLYKRKLATPFDCGRHDDITAIEVLISTEASEAFTHSLQASLAVDAAERSKPQ